MLFLVFVSKITNSVTVVLKCQFNKTKPPNALLRAVFKQKRMKFGSMRTEIKICLMTFFQFSVVVKNTSGSTLAK